MADLMQSDAIPPGAHCDGLLFKAGAEGRVAVRAHPWADDDTHQAFPGMVIGE